VLVSGASYHCWTHWGRIGESGQNHLEACGSAAAAIAALSKKFKDKVRIRGAVR
jgi:poly [ADP-ribose] polymerase